MNHMPIGVFDSGLGGLTVVRVLKKILPNENIVYLGDTGRVPYGTRSTETVSAYAMEDIRFLLSKKVKMIIAACGTVSSVAMGVATGLKTPITGVVIPSAASAVKATKNKKIGIIGTSVTVNSRAYEVEIKKTNPEIQVFGRACPLFVTMVENGFISADNEITQTIVKHYITPFKETGIDTLVLGCTHFPLLKDAISTILPDVTLVDTGEETAGFAAKMLKEGEMLNTMDNGGENSYFVTDNIQNFSSVAQLFLGENISEKVIKVDL